MDTLVKLEFGVTKTVYICFEVCCLSTYVHFHTFLLSDANECTIGTHNCHTNADCTNNAGSFTCACKTGYSGDGVTCNGWYS